MNDDLISREALKEHKFVGIDYRINGKTLENINRAYQQGWNDAIDAIIDNAPTVPLPDFKEGYKQAIIDGKTNFSRPQDELAEEVWELYEKHHSHLATYVYEFGEELKELLHKYQKGA